MKKRAVRRYILLGAAIFLGLLTFFFLFRKTRTAPTDKYLTVTVERGDIRRTVSSTGTLQAVVNVQVGSQVSGRVQEINADFNSVVKKGQILAVIDPANFQAQRERAEAQLATSLATVKNAEANLVTRKAEIENARANLEVAKVNLKEAERQKVRAEGLFKDGLIPERDSQTAEATYDQCRARVLQADAQINQAEAGIRSAISQQDQAAASVKQAQAELRMAEVNLFYTNIISPIDGIVIERNVDIGQTVAASFQTPTLFLIANDLSRMQLIAQIDEADIGVLSEKAAVDFAVDAFPGQVFHGKIAEIRLTSKLPTTTSSGTSQSSASGGTASNVVVYNVIIEVENPQLKLRPAMTANVSFTVASAHDVLWVANSALRYRPPGLSPEEVQRLLESKNLRKMGEARGLDTANPSSGSIPLSSTSTALADGEVKHPPENKELSRTEPSSSLSIPKSSLHSQPATGQTKKSKIKQGEEAGPQTSLILSATDSYGIHGGMKIRFPQAEENRLTPGVLWLLDSDGNPQPKRVKLGITNGKETAIYDTDLKVGDTIVTGEISGTEGTPAPRNTSPFRGPFSPAVPAPRRGGTR
ncbi:MAG: efflux RND transporter periplasmic adaptor subunit [Terriglobia bacterium]